MTDHHPGIPKRHFQKLPRDSKTKTCPFVVQFLKGLYLQIPGQLLDFVDRSPACLNDLGKQLLYTTSTASKSSNFPACCKQETRPLLHACDLSMCNVAGMPASSKMDDLVKVCEGKRCMWSCCVLLAPGTVVNTPHSSPICLKFTQQNLTER